MGALNTSKHVVATLSAGPAWQSSGRTQRLFLTPAIEKSYVANQATNVFAEGELFLGTQKNLTNQWIGQIGLALMATSAARLSGDIWDDADPQFNNYTYDYKVNHAHLAVKGKLFLDRGYWLMPWVSGSAGVGFNRARDYVNTPTIFEAVVNPDFADHTETAFTYTLGLGLQRNLNANWQLGVGYEFADWGRSSLGRAPGQTLNTGLSLNHLYTNGVLFNISYIA
ncbi:MAG: porin family protein [Legionella sp.]|nr:porin family protein [Legionella sp.]